MYYIICNIQSPHLRQAGCPSWFACRKLVEPPFGHPGSPAGATRRQELPIARDSWGRFEPVVSI